MRYIFGLKKITREHVAKWGFARTFTGIPLTLVGQKLDNLFHIEIVVVSTDTFDN
jgi:hypothetical protein